MERECIRQVIAHIEEHLTQELSNAQLAEVAGYSEFHFLRLFRAQTGLTPADYIRKRRLSEVVKRIGSGHAMSELAFAYGFNSKENFTRAFRREHGILPTEFRAADCSLRLYEPFAFAPDFLHPAVSMAHLRPFAVIVYPCDEAFPPRFWNRYNAGGYSARLSGGVVVPDWGVMQRDPLTGKLSYWIGVREEHAQGDRTGTVRLPIRGGLYATFDTAPATQHDFVQTIHRTWDWIYDVWLPASGYRRGPGYEMECYTETDRTYSERIFVPLERNEDNG